MHIIELSLRLGLCRTLSGFLVKLQDSFLSQIYFSQMNDYQRRYDAWLKERKREDPKFNRKSWRKGVRKLKDYGDEDEEAEIDEEEDDPEPVKPGGVFFCKFYFHDLILFCTRIDDLLITKPSVVFVKFRLAGQ